MKFYPILIFLLHSFISSAQIKTVESFANLEILEFEEREDGLSRSIRFDSNISVVINDKLDLDYKYLEQENYVVASNSTKLIETVLNRHTSEKYFITWGPIDGFLYGFTIFESSEPHKILGQICFQILFDHLMSLS